MVPGGQLAEDGTTRRPVEETSTTPGIPPGVSYMPNRSGQSSAVSPGVESWPWLMTRPPAPTRTCSLPAAATMIVPLPRA
jgi:hypothetical protein